MKIPVEQIEIPNPTSDIDEQILGDLKDSIVEQGLSHNIIVRRANINGGYILVSGEKRLLAAKMAGWTEIEAEVRDVTERKGREIRLHENLKRFNLPWWEQVILVEELHKLRQEEHGIAQRGRPSRDDDFQKQGWSIRDTAEELGVGIGPLSEDLNLARALHSDPNLAKVRDKKTAIKLVRNAMSRVQAEVEAGLPIKFEANEAYFGDSTAILQQLPDLSIDHCITDPPWIKFFEPSLRIDERTLPVFKELYRVLRPGSFLFVFSGLDDYAYYAGSSTPNPDNPSETIHNKGELEKIGFSTSNTPVIWQKTNALSRRGVRAWEYDRDFEFIVVAVKGTPTLTTSRRLSGVKTYPIVPPMKMLHPNEKPLALLKDIIDDCSYEGNIIIDPFAGSGVLGEACQETKRRYILIERDKKFYDQIVKRLGG